MSSTEKPQVPPVETAEQAFAAQAAEQAPGLIREFYDFLRYNKAWWLTPIILVLLLVGGLCILAATGAAPFIYTIF